MSAAEKNQSPGDRASGMTRLLNTVERLGNLLPHPVVLFAILCLVVLAASFLAHYFGLSVVDPRPEGSRGRVDSGLIEAVNLLNTAGLHRVLSELVGNFTGFAPLGTVLVSMLGVGVAEKSGLISACMRRLVLGAPSYLVTFAVVLAGVLSSTAAELGYVVLIPLAAVIFHSIGRHPLAGLAAAFAGVSGGYSANVLLGPVDPLLSGLTQQAAGLIAPGYPVGPEANWFFMIGSTFFIALAATLITERIVEPKLGPYRIDESAPELRDELHQELVHSALRDDELKGLKVAGLVACVFLAVLVVLVVPESGILRHPMTGLVAGSPFLQSIIFFIFIFFLVTGVAYGKVVGTICNGSDVVKAMNSAMSAMGPYIVLVFFAAQFIAYFEWSNLGAIIAVLGAQSLTSVGLDGPVLFFGFIAICSIINLSLGSASAQWAMTAPIFVPMLMLLGYAPEVIQAAYRIGDSSTNIITPMMPYFGLILAVAERYRQNVGVGTLMSIMLPYTVVFLVGWSVFFYLWVFVAGLPVGPGAPIYFNP